MISVVADIPDNLQRVLLGTPFLTNQSRSHSKHNEYQSILWQPRRLS